jgi:hypothetical protein
MPTLRRRLGITAHELPRFLWGLRPGRRRERPPWLWIRNRREALKPAPDGRGVRCNWPWTSDLVVPAVYPGLARRLLRRCLGDWPIELCERRVASAPEPRVSFVIGHRGEERLAHLLLTVASIAGQRDVGIECLVVEQASRATAAPSLPDWVRHVHTPPPEASMPYSRSWAFNVGARLARGPLLVFHDNDMLVPGDYARELHARFAEGAEVINLKRFIFYLDAADTARVLAARRLTADVRPERVVQNAEAGGSVALSRRAFEEIGGFDESFLGWGGEDNELWERSRHRAVYGFGYLPIVHLWHASQPEKEMGNSGPGSRLYQQRTRQPAPERIARLRALPQGRLEGPTTETSP